MGRVKVLSAVSLGLALVCSGHPVIASPATASVAAESQPEKKRNGGSSIAVWTAVGAALFAVFIATRRRKSKTGSDTPS